MITGHVGVSFYVKGKYKKESILYYLIAVMLPDIASQIQGIIFWFLGQKPPINFHSIPSTLLLAVITSIIIYVIKKNYIFSILMGLLVISHTMADYITSYMPLFGNDGIKFGLNLYSNQILDCIIEIIFVLIGWFVYRKLFPKQKNRKGLYFMLGFLIIVQIILTLIY